MTGRTAGGLDSMAVASSGAAEELSAIVESVLPAREDARAFDILTEGTVIELKPGEEVVAGLQ